MEIKYSDAVYVIDKGRIITYKDGVEVEVNLGNVEGFYVVAPGLIRELFQKALDAEGEKK